MQTFSANLGFLWTNLSLPDAIYRAKEWGFDAVECHWPYETPAQDVTAALQGTGLNMLGINTRPGDLQAGEFGLAAIVGAEGRARSDISEAIDYAASIGAANVHVMAGKSTGNQARQCFVENLKFACKIGAGKGVSILIEPINTLDMPGYFLSSMNEAADILADVERNNIAVMFDCYHIARMGGDVEHQLEAYMPSIGHIQFASVPDRGPPNRGRLNYDSIFATLDQLGYSEPIGAEYKPVSDTDASLDWLSTYKKGEPIHNE